MRRQLERMPHVVFGGLTHELAIELGRKLLKLLPVGLDRIFYCDSGSVAVKVAMKMAVQYQLARGNRDKLAFATIRGSYHGDTWKAMSVSEPVNEMHALFRHAVSIQYFLPRPAIRHGEDWSDDRENNGLNALERLFETKGARIAGLVPEPLVQGAGGMFFCHPQWLRQAKALCEAFDVLLIFDEIATGFGRTGKMFAMDHVGATPDIICLGKALTGGHIAFTAAIASEHVALGIGEGTAGVFMHRPDLIWPIPWPVRRVSPA